jgi:glycosyltransferase involved in cell wall biosynthesis
MYGRELSKQVRAFSPDVVISGNTPLDVQLALRRATVRGGGRFVFWVQDFYGIAIERHFSGRWRGLGTVISRRYRRIETSLLRKSDGVVLISPAFIQHLPPSLIGSKAVQVIRNWGALDLISPRSRNNPWRERMGLADKFVFMYTGTLGLKHDPRLLLALSDAFLDDENIAIVVVASGSSAEHLKTLSKAQPRKNLVLYPLQPAADFPDVLATADVAVAILESDAAEFSVPSKLLSYLCAGRAILLSAPLDNLSVQILEESGGGVAVSPHDADAFVRTAQSLVADHSRRAEYARAGRAYAETHFPIADIAIRFENIFHSCLRPAQPAIAADPPMIGVLGHQDIRRLLPDSPAVTPSGAVSAPESICSD